MDDLIVTFRTLATVGFVLLLVLLRLDAERFGTAEYDERSRDGAPPSLRGRLAAHDDPKAALTAFLARQAMGRFGTAEEIAALAVYLASDEAKFVTGQTFVIDGGMAI